VFAVIYALFNVAASTDMINKWRENDGAVKEFAHTPDLQPLLEYLGSKDVEYCYASFWIAYRITFESDEHIVCAVPFNERFSGWSVPNKNRIDKKSDVPYVLMDTNRSELTPEFFEFDLAKSKFVSEQADVGKFRVFYDFSHPGFDFDQPLPRTSYSISTLENPDRDLQEMHDGDINTYWTSDNKQQKWMGLEVKLDVPSNIQRITLRYAEEAIKQPRMLWISTLKQGEWSHVKRSWYTLTKIDSENGSPVYGRYQNVIWFDTPMTIEAIRLKNAIPDYTINWSIAELELGTRNAASPEASTKQERW
jgi:hypothetical protein